jgi:hypothetical protein
MLEVLLDSPARDRYDRSLTALARAVSGEPLPKNLRQRIPEWIGPTAIVAGAALLLVLLLALWPARPPGAAAPAAPVTGVAAVEPLREQAIEHDMDWEPLVTYAYSSHLPIPPLPFSEPAAMPPARDPPPSRRARATK